MPFLCLRIDLFGEGLGIAGVILPQWSRSPFRVSRRSHDLPSHVLVIASLLICGARRVFVLQGKGLFFPFNTLFRSGYGAFCIMF